MGFFNFIITMGVGLVMVFGGVLTYQHRMAEQQMEEPLAAVVAPAKTKTRDSGLAALPKRDNKNTKGLTYRP